MRREEAEPAVSPPSRTPEPPGVQRAAVPGIPRGLGNRALGRWALALSREEATTPKSVPVLLVGPPPPVEAVKRATPENLELAKQIDALESLKDEQLERARDVAAAGAVGTASDEQRRELQKLEAIELLMRRRSQAGSIFHPLATNYSGSDDSTPRRLNVRALLEQGVRKTGSFREGAEAPLPHQEGRRRLQVLRTGGCALQEGVQAAGAPERETDAARQLGRD